MSVTGPIARSVADVGLALDAFAGSDKDPLSRRNSTTTSAYRKAGEMPKKINRFAFSMDLNVAVISAEVKDIVSTAMIKLQKSGCDVRNECPNLLESHFVFDTLRAFQFATLWSTTLIQHRDKLNLKLFEYRKGSNLDVKNLMDAERIRFSLVRHDRFP